LDATFRAGAVHSGRVVADRFDFSDALRRAGTYAGPGRRVVGGQKRVERAAADAGADGDGGEADAGV
jgi:hypothetical protein